MTRQLLELAMEFTTAKERAGLAEDGAPPTDTSGAAGAPPAKGTIEHAVAKVY